VLGNAVSNALEDEGRSASRSNCANTQQTSQQQQSVSGGGSLDATSPSSSSSSSSSSCVGLFATREITKGEEVLIDYGHGTPLSNERLLLEYGFTLDGEVLRKGYGGAAAAAAAAGESEGKSQSGALAKSSSWHRDSVCVPLAAISAGLAAVDATAAAAGRVEELSGSSSSSKVSARDAELVAELKAVVLVGGSLGDVVEAEGGLVFFSSSTESSDRQQQQQKHLLNCRLGVVNTSAATFALALALTARCPSELASAAEKATTTTALRSSSSSASERASDVVQNLIAESSEAHQARASFALRSAAAATLAELPTGVNTGHAEIDDAGFGAACLKYSRSRREILIEASGSSAP
jgi:hypothetical protein